MTGPKLWQQFTIEMIVPSKPMNAFLRKIRVLSPRRQTIRDSRVLALYVLITSIVVGAVGVPASATDGVNVCDVDALMLRLMSKYNVPGLALALIKDHRIVMEKGYGFRDLETRAPVTTETLFNIGSISKSFTALGIVQLVDEHKVNLDTPIIKYLPDCG
jgi:CubicO group peptidase (beta-lactamase class C family)